MNYDSRSAVCFTAISNTVKGDGISRLLQEDAMVADSEAEEALEPAE